MTVDKSINFSAIKLFISLIKNDYIINADNTALSQETKYNNEGKWEEETVLLENELDTLRRQAEIKAAEIQARKHGQPNYTIDKDVLEDIDAIITKKTSRYPTWEKFVDESLKNMITFWQRPQDMTTIAGKLWKPTNLKSAVDGKKGDV